MDLRAYLKKTGIKQRALARELGIAEPHMSRLVNRKGSPSLDLALRIARATDNKVKPTDLMRAA